MFKKVIGCVFALMAANASASIVTYQFQAKVDDMFEYDGATQVITTVTSSTMSGSLIAIGDSITGWFSYDTNALRSTYVPDPSAPNSWVRYDGGASISLTLSPSGVSYQSGTDSWSSSIDVANDAPALLGSDVFALFTSAWSPTEFATADLFFDDLSALALASSDIPAQLSLSKFQYSNVGYNWLRQRDGSQVHARGGLTSLQLVGVQNDVPEPDTIALSLIGLASLGYAARRRIRRHD